MLAATLTDGLACPLGEQWLRIFSALRALLASDQDLAEGEYALAEGPENGGAMAMVSVYDSKRPATGRYESHRIMADIQLVLQGEEFVDITALNGLTPAAPYDVARDITFYREKPAPLARVHLRPGNFALLLPEDAHMPSLAVQRPAAVKKMVVKLPVKTLKRVH